MKMKNFLLLSLVALLMTIINAHAEVYECSNENGKYLVALTSDSGVLFRHENGYFQDMNTEVKVARAMDGGPTFVTATERIGNDWGSRGCFEMYKVTQFVINRASTIQNVPHFALNPDQTGCDHRSLPRPLVIPPQNINCTLK